MISPEEILNSPGIVPLNSPALLRIHTANQQTAAMNQPALCHGAFRRAALLGMLIAATPLAVQAGGFALTPQNAVHLGNAFSAAAAAEDASTIHYNPAGLLHLDRPEAVVNVTYFMFGGDFSNTGSTTAGVLPTPGGNGGDLGSHTPIPTAYFAYPFSDTFAAGIGITAPYGLSTEYDAGWVGRYHALKSELTVININPAIAWRLADWLRLGIGLDWQSADAELSNAIDFGLLGFANEIPGFAPHSADGTVTIDGDDHNWGWNIGLLIQANDALRIGWHYRSHFAHTLTGRARFAAVPAPFQPMFPDQAASAPFSLPEVMSLSLLYEFNPRLALTADWSWWNWSRFENLDVDFENPATPDVSLPQNWNDASIYSVGLRWRYSDTLTLRCGFALNESPVPSSGFRYARIPDSDRTWYTIGASWKVADAARLHFGYALLDFEKSTSAYDDLAGHVLVGDYDLSAHILSAQFTWGF